MGTDNGVAVGQSLRTAGVFEQASYIVVGDFPDQLPLGIEFNDFVSMGQRSHGMTIVEPDGCKRPVLGRPTSQRLQIGFDGPYDLAPGCVLLDGKR